MDQVLAFAKKRRTAKGRPVIQGEAKGRPVIQGEAKGRPVILSPFDSLRSLRAGSAKDLILPAKASPAMLDTSVSSGSVDAP